MVIISGLLVVAGLAGPAAIRENAAPRAAAGWRVAQAPPQDPPPPPAPPEDPPPGGKNKPQLKNM